MPHSSNALVLEITKQGDLLTLSIFERIELTSTVKYYSQLSIPIHEVNSACKEITSILNKSTFQQAGYTHCRSKPGEDTYLLPQLKKAGLFLWDSLLTGSVKNTLLTAKTFELIISLDEELIWVPWELLYDGKEFLCLKFNIGRVVRTKQRLRPLQYRDKDNVLKMLILANPTGDLKSSYLEGMYINKQFSRKWNQIKIDFKSTNIDALYVKQNLRDYDIVHFAGHCEYDTADTKNTGWILSDGRFTTRDIIALSESLSLPNLIFSNACTSASASQDLMDADYQKKTYSLAAAFLFSGVKHYIGTIWQVEDPVSLLFAKEFYDNLLKGRHIGECIRQGRLKLAQDKGISWAGYILYGDPNYVLFSETKKVETSHWGVSTLLKKNIINFVIAAIIILIAGLGYFYMPVKHPNTYFLFLKSKKLFQNGINSQVITVSNEIIKTGPLFLPVYPLIADTYERMGSRENSLKYYFEYALNSQKRRDNKNLISAYVGIGWLYQLSGDYPKSFDFYNKAVTLSKETHNKLQEAVALRKLALWYIDKEDYNKAMELLMKSSGINQEKPHIYEHRYNLACDYFDIGLVFSDKDDYAAAKEFYGKSLAIFEKMKLDEELSDYYFNLGELCLFDKHYEKALAYYKKGLMIDVKHDNKPSLAADYNMIGELYMEMGNVEEAQKQFSKAISLSLEIKAMPDLAAAYQNMGNLYKKINDSNNAKQYLVQAREIYQKIDTPSYKRITAEIKDLKKLSQGP